MPRGGLITLRRHDESQGMDSFCVSFNHAWLQNEQLRIDEWKKKKSHMEAILNDFVTFLFCLCKPLYQVFELICLFQLGVLGEINTDQHKDSPLTGLSV